MSFRRLPSTVRPLLLAISFVLFLLADRVLAANNPKTLTATTNNHTLTLEVARSDNERAQGLMYRRELARDAGMLFIFPATQQQNFWMKNTPLPLDLIFLDENKTVVGVVERAVPFSTKTFGIEQPSRYVIEVNAGVAKELGVNIGTKVEF